MAQSFQRLITFAKTVWPEISGHAFSEWGTRKTTNRFAMRKDLRQNFATSLEEEVLDLRKPPHFKTHSTSISHTADLGAWVAIPRPAQVGVDVERIVRLKLPVIKRMCSESEILAALPGAEALWSAKEAFFKALENHQPQTISQLAIHNWCALEDEIFSFEGTWAAVEKFSAHGLWLKDSTHTFSLCVVHVSS